MKIEGQGQLLRIFIGESDRWEGRPLHEAIVRAAREAGLAGTTVLRGVEGFGASSRIHTVRVLRLSEDLPLVIEIVDRADAIAGFLPTLDTMVAEGMVTLEQVNVLMYRHSGDTPPAIDDGELELEGSADTPAPTPAPEFPEATDRARNIITLARAQARQSHRGFVDSVDVLLAMIREPGGIAGHVLADLGIQSDTVEKCLRDEVSRESPTDNFLAQLYKNSVSEANLMRDRFVGTEHLLLALCETRPSAATDIFMRLGCQPRELCQDVLEILGRHDDWQRWLADHPDM